MPDDTTILSLPLILPAQAQKHVTHNEALATLDLIVQLAVITRTLTTPPALPTLGDRHIVAAGATGAWVGQAGKIALFDGAGWQFTQALPGWQAHVLAEGQTAVFDGLVWAAPSDKPLAVTRLGVSATADATNRLSVAAPATLLNHAGAGHQLKLNKATAADTASLLFQTGFGGRAEMGTAGTDDFAIKVSADGSTFATALSAAAATGEVTLPLPLHLGGQATDPVAPPDGTLWLNTTSGEVKVKSAGVTLAVGGGGGVSDGDKGDITVSALGATWTIDAGAVGLSKLADMPTDSFLGRDTAGAGAPEVLTPAVARAILNVADGATANASNAALRDRASHTGSQTAATISDFAAAVAATAAVTANTAKVTNATHTGDVTGSGALTVQPVAITGKAAVTAVGADYVLISDTSDGGALKKALVSDLGGSGGSPGGLTGTVQFNNAGTFAGAADVAIEDGQLRLAQVTGPTAPAANGLKLFGGKLGEMLVPGFVGPTGGARLLQPFIGVGPFRMWEPVSGTTASTIGASIAFTGTQTAAGYAEGSRRARLRRIEALVTTAATTAVAGWRDNLNQVSIGGTNAWEGGFSLVLHWGPATGMSNANRRAFAGLWSGAAPTDLDPTALLNVVGMSYYAAVSNIQFIHNDGAGAVTAIDLGAGFPKPSVDRANTYRLELFSPPGPTQLVSYQVVNLESGDVASGTVTTNLPATTLIDLKPSIWSSVGGTSAVTGVAVGKMLLQMEY
ncbi:MAG: hypothetical protein B7Z10_04760 [Rhodobacterales bacterium 32-66-7]|nr:MAG: hypothetical protein B7Z10_04760 [Rhodobacterales bacterium 32-66-7]